jgi:hypothetical protein
MKVKKSAYVFSIRISCNHTSAPLTLPLHMPGVTILEVVVVPTPSPTASPTPAPDTAAGTVNSLSGLAWISTLGVAGTLLLANP